MPEPIIDNPIINSPYREPTRHFRFSEEGITNEIVEKRRLSSYFVPIANPRSPQIDMAIEQGWTKERERENVFINKVRGRVTQWRAGGYLGVTNVTRELLEYWTNPDREKKFFFCQIEALETAIYIAEVAQRYGDQWILNTLKEANDTSNPGLPRIALKMATGSGKTVVMAMIIAWQALNKLAHPQDARFSDSFLLIAPGITVRDRLRVLLPSDADNYYRMRDVVPSHRIEKLGQAKFVITNFHAFMLKEKIAASKLTKSILSSDAFTETPDQMVRRVCRSFGSKRNVIVINDEAHHCYRRKPEDSIDNLRGEEKKETQKMDEEARIWISGIEAVKAKIGVRAIYDLSATPFFLRGSGHKEGDLFPWVVSDFSLIDAIESGIVKVPRVPIDDDQTPGKPTYRDLWPRVRDGLPKKGRKTDAIGDLPQLPAMLQSALHSLYSNYEKSFERWRGNTEAIDRGVMPPVMIIVCSNTNVSKLIYDYVAGWEKQVGDRQIAQAGRLEIFRNDDGHGGWLSRPNTILVDSMQLESGEGMSEEFKRIAAREISEFKDEYRQRFPGRDADALTDEDLLREVMNTVGKAGKLGEHVKCVVSVSMLTEGWDANTVTHILGVRAFGTQLLCEQVVGRGLRRMSYALNDEGMFNPEYAEVYGVPFTFIPCSGSTVEPAPQAVTTRVRTIESRSACEITFPRLLGYRYEIRGDILTARFTADSHLSLSTQDVPTKIEVAPIVGEKEVHKLDDLKRHRVNEVAFVVTKLCLDKYFRDQEGNDKPWLFPQLLGITKRWMMECLHTTDSTFPQLLLLTQFAHAAAERIYASIVQSRDETKKLIPILQPYDTVGSTRFVDFDTTREVYKTRENLPKCHISHVVADTKSWEQKLAQTLEGMEIVVRYVKNHNLGFTIPYVFEGVERSYTPDFIACIDDGHGSDDLLNLIIEVSGEARKDKAAKLAAARTLWVPAVNNHGGFGRWDVVEITDPYIAESTIMAFLSRNTNPLKVS